MFDWLEGRGEERRGEEGRGEERRCSFLSSDALLCFHAHGQTTDTCHTTICQRWHAFTHARLKRRRFRTQSRASRTITTGWGAVDVCVFVEHMLPKSHEPVTALHMLAAHAPPPSSSLLLLSPPPLLVSAERSILKLNKRILHISSPASEGGCDTTPWQAGTQGGRQGSVPEG